MDSAEVDAVGTEQINADYDNVLAEIETFAQEFKLNDGRKVFMIYTQPPLPTEEARMGRIEGALQTMRNWSPNPDVPEAWPPNAQQTVSSFVDRIDQQLQEIASLKVFLNEEGSALG